MNNDDKGTGYRKLWWLVPLVLVIYVLSIGPAAAYINDDDHPLVGLAKAFYAPVIWLYEHNNLAGRFLGWWVGVWMGD